MKSIKIALSLLLCLCLVICLCSCGGTSTPIELNLGPYRSEEAVTIYQTVCDAVNAQTNWKLNVISDKTITMSADTYKESYIQSLTYVNYGTESMRAHNTTIYTCGQNRIHEEEFYLNDTLYTCVNSNRFCGPMEPKEFTARFVPAILLSEANYQSIYLQTNDSGTVITFSDAIAPESWYNIDKSVFQSASGKVTLDASGQLTESSYSLSYSHGETVVRETITTRFNVISSSAIKELTAPESYLPLAHPQIPLHLETAAGFLTQAGSVNSFILETSTSQATGMEYQFATNVTMVRNHTDLQASTSYDSIWIDHSRDGAQIRSMQSEEFRNGEYTFKDHAGVLQTDPTVSAAAMEEYILNLLVQNIAMPDHILTSDAIISDTTETLIFTMDDEMAQHMKQYVCEELSMDASLLDSLSQSYRTESLICTMTIDRVTGCPIEITIHYAGEHTIEGQAYRLTYDLKQTFTFGIPH